MKTKEKRFSIQYEFAIRGTACLPQASLPMPLAPRHSSPLTSLITNHSSLITASPHRCASTAGADGGTTGWCPSSFPVIIALRICAKISVKVFGVCGIKIVFV